MQSINSAFMAPRALPSLRASLLPGALALCVTTSLIGGMVHAFDARSRQVISDTRQAQLLARDAAPGTPEPIVGMAGAVVQGFVRPAERVALATASPSGEASVPTVVGALETIVVVGKRMTQQEIAQARAEIARERAALAAAPKVVALRQ